MLIHLGVIDLSESLLSRIFPGVVEKLPSLLKEAPSDKTPPSPSEGPMLSAEQAFVLRASAIDACEMIIAETRASVLSKEGVEWIKEITLPELDMWIWGVAKDRSDYRQLKRFVLRETIFF